MWTWGALLVVLCAVCGASAVPCRKQEDTLVLAHVLFRHGNRTANGIGELYPKDPYYNKTYFPIGLGQLTNAGKEKEYNLGRLLRERYNSFLGDVVYPDIAVPRSTDFNRTKVSLLFCLAGLFPPKGENIWSDLNWQAIPYNYLPRNNDPLLMGTECPNYFIQYDENRYSDKQQAEFEPFKETFDYISDNSGLNVTSFKEIYDLYFGISTEEEYGLELPDWLNKVWPKTIVELSIKEYYVSVATTNLKRFAAGYLIQKIVEDTIAKTKEDPNNEFKKKLYLYSAHENNLAQLMVTLDIFDDHIPNYGSYITLEVHKIEGVYGFKVFYENYYPSGPVQLKFPACGEFCPLEKFVELYEEYYPTSETLCG